MLSGIQPSGDVHLGNYVGALRNWVAMQERYDAFYPIVDLHALTLPWDPAELPGKTLQTAQILMAAGIDPERATIFVQSHVPEHAELCWILNCVATVGELSRMVQFKEKTRSRSQDSASVGLFDYPVLQVADILIYDADLVPVGEDQRQHVELTRNIAQRFNNRFGETFVVPEVVVPELGAKIYDLQEPTNKMSKSADSPRGTVMVFDPPEVIERKVKRAVTDPQTNVRYDPEHKPGVSNLLTILAVSTGRTPDEVAESYSEYGSLKADAAAALVEFLRPLRERYTELADDPGETAAVLKRGAEKAQQVAGTTLARAKEAIGLLPRA
ncbi:MAG: tryptophan--tRNA ligase [Acidimicrobiia bacterium]|nr:tryptophan--tRNA ligase [Acidimicrobiia bacterium]